MKHLLNGVAIAAALAIAIPAWAQAPKPPAGPTEAAPASAGAPMASKQRHKRVSHRTARRGGRGMGGGDTMTEQLNREELSRLQGGGMPAAAPGPMNGGAGQGGPRASGH